MKEAKVERRQMKENALVKVSCSARAVITWSSASEGKRECKKDEDQERKREREKVDEGESGKGIWRCIGESRYS